LPNSKGVFLQSRFGYIKKFIQVDVVLLALHGINGEDGSLKALLDIINIPCINSNILASSLALDKCCMLNYCKSFGNIDVINGFSVSSEYDESEILDKISSCGLDFPVIIKPARLGSSIGITICHNKDELNNKLKFSLKFDNQVLLQKKIENFNEYNIAIFRDCKNLVVSEIEQPLGQDEILSYSDKYLNGTKKSAGMDQVKRVFPAVINDVIRNQIIDVAKFIYNDLNLMGVVRFDFIFDMDSQKLYLNELNTIPGSYAYYLFPNLTFSEILDKCIKTVFFMQQKNNNIITYFESSVLRGVGGVKK